MQNSLVEGWCTEPIHKDPGCPFSSTSCSSCTGSIWCWWLDFLNHNWNIAFRRSGCWWTHHRTFEQSHIHTLNSCWQFLNTSTNFFKPQMRAIGSHFNFLLSLRSIPRLAIYKIIEILKLKWQLHLFKNMSLFPYTWNEIKTMQCVYVGVSFGSPIFEGWDLFM